MLRADVRRPTLVGMNNPLSDRPEMALWPSPPGCTGWRIWKMLEDRAGLGTEDYTEAFDRVNVLNAREYSTPDARAAAADLLQRLGGRTRVVVLGAAPLAALRLQPVHPGHWGHCKPDEHSAGMRYTTLPHPSGRCRWYNEYGNRRLAQELLFDLYTQWQDDIATASAAG